ncbi:DUF2509 family protein [Pantoea wallisii]|nr:DUF2509 family protein [Pantoea wallisii]
MNQQGNSTLGMVLMLLLLGGMTLHATRTRLAQSMPLVADAQQHHQDYWQAQAALEWGLRQNWPQADSWQCQSEAEQQWQSCLLHREDDDGLLSGRRAGSTLWLFRQVSLHASALQTQPHGWIDYCPLAKAELCPPQDEPAGL